MSSSRPHSTRPELLATIGAGMVGTGVDFEPRADEWVGARPCAVGRNKPTTPATPSTTLPLVGRSPHPRVFVSVGHGMWGMTLGLIPGEPLAGLVSTDWMPAALRAVDPVL